MHTNNIHFFRINKIHVSMHDKTNKMACASSKDSDQPGPPPSLIRVFPVSMKKAWGSWLPLEHTAKTLIRLGGCPGWCESLLGVHAILLVLSCTGSDLYRLPLLIWSSSYLA